MLNIRVPEQSRLETTIQTCDKNKRRMRGRTIAIKYDGLFEGSRQRRSRTIRRSRDYLCDDFTSKKTKIWNKREKRRETLVGDDCITFLSGSVKLTFSKN